MVKKQFDYIENRIREAAANSEPAFDESAWTQMEARLDKEEKKRRRFLLWWSVLPLLFIGVGGVTYFILNNKHAEKTGTYQSDKNIARDKSLEQKLEQKNTSAETITPVNSGVDAGRKMSLGEKAGLEISQNVKQSHDKNIDAEKEFVSYKGNKYHSTRKGKLSSKIRGPEIDAINETAGNVDKNNNMPDQSPVEKYTETPVKKDPENKATVSVPDTVVKIDSAKKMIAKNVSDSNVISKNKAKETRLSKFYFLASIGAEVAGVKLFSYSGSQITPKYGVGIGYQINKKLSVQTGFYAGTKKYVAGPDDYNAKYGSYWNTVQIIKVDAACLVYDIPITVRYNFALKPSAVYYATAGLSSFIMKREDYNYLYTRNNVIHELAWTYTGNKNFLSVFNLSAGIEKRLSPTISIQAEPSISLPISGVGDGKVKLYSTALQVALKYNPYRKHK